MHEFYADDYADAFKGIGTFNVDISMHKQLEDELRNSEALVRQVLEACPVPVTMNRVDDGVIYIKRLRQTRAIDGFEVRYRKTDGEQFRCALSSRLIEYRGEEVVVTSLFDLTERYAVEEELARHREMLHRSEKLSALGELLFSIAHELNNPLSVVTGQTELLQETSDNPRTVARARKIGDAAERCGRIVNTFLAMARQRPLESRAVDLVVLDITMPGEDGLSLARYLREKTASYIVMLTSAGAVVDRIVGLEIGADDYLPKPVILRELHARIRSVLRYGKPPAQAVTQSTASGGNVRFGTCRLHLASQKLYDSRAEEIPLSARELQLLRVFTERPNHSLSRDQIFNLTHNRDWHPCDRSLDLCISRLRRKIEADPANPRVIKTVHGVGYVFAQE